MQISLIVATDLNGVIGAKGRLPWHLPADLKHFRRSTLHKPVIMGRRTYDSIGRPLPKRQNIVLTQRSDFSAPGCQVANSLHHAIGLAREGQSGAPDEAMVIGGGQIYRQFLPYADRILMTVVCHHHAGDTYFVQLDPSQWRVSATEQRDADAANPYELRFVTLERQVVAV